MIERPPVMNGSLYESVRDIYEYLKRLADELQILEREVKKNDAVEEGREGR